MKSPALILLILIACFGGCKKDFDLTADYKETPVVYGLLNTQDATHYIRIQKGYLVDGDAIPAAGITDSIYYADSLTVKLIPYTGGNAGPPIILHKVVGNNLPKDSGTFAYAPNVLYSYTGKLDSLKAYKLEVTNTSNGYRFFAPKRDANNPYDGIPMISDFTINLPNQDIFAKGIPISIFQGQTSFQITWEKAVNASIYDVKVRFPYKEFEVGTNAFVRDSFVEVYMLKGGTGIAGTGSAVYTNFNTFQLLTALKNSIAVRPDRYRTFDVQKAMTFYFTAGGNELSKYISSQAAQGSGLASNEALPPYTNIDGGYGIFSSRFNKQVDSVVLSSSSLDSIACHPITAGLNFKRWNGQFCQ